METANKRGNPAQDHHGNENVTMRFLDIKERDHGGGPSGPE
jgi:hypothetical protein